MISDTLKSVMQKEGAVAIVAQGKNFPHVVNTWHSYVTINHDSFILPVAGMNTMEEALVHDNRVLVTVGSKEVEGLHGDGAGFLLNGNATIVYEGDECDQMRANFPWARAVMKIAIKNFIQTT